MKMRGPIDVQTGGSSGKPLRSTRVSMRTLSPISSGVRAIAFPELFNALSISSQAAHQATVTLIVDHVPRERILLTSTYLWQRVTSLVRPHSLSGSMISPHVVGSQKHSRATGEKKKAGLIRKYGLNMSRQAFREKHEEIGFKKASPTLRPQRHINMACRSIVKSTQRKA